MKNNRENLMDINGETEGKRPCIIGQCFLQFKYSYSFPFRHKELLVLLTSTWGNTICYKFKIKQILCVYGMGWS